MSETSGYMGGPGNNFSPDNAEQAAVLAQTYAAFNEDRWRRVGASDDEVVQLRVLHDQRSLDEQSAEGQRLASLSDGDLAAELDVHRATGGSPDKSPYNGTVKEVLAEVGDDPDKAREALAFEKSGFGKKRSTLIESLEEIVADAESGAGSDGAGDGDGDGDPNPPQGTTDNQQTGLAQGDTPGATGSSV